MGALFVFPGLRLAKTQWDLLKFVFLISVKLKKNIYYPYKSVSKVVLPFDRYAYCTIDLLLKTSFLFLDITIKK